jgi:hypothetical protein
MAEEITPEVVEEIVIDFKNPFTPNLSYKDWLEKNKLKTLEDVVKFVEKLDLTEEQKEFVKNDVKHII